MIGLVSCFEVYNYGSQLMSLALQMMMDEFGYTSEHINYLPKHDAHYILSLPLKILNSSLSEHRRELKQKHLLAERDSVYNKQLQMKKKAFDCFVRDYMRVSIPICGYNQLRQRAENYDCVLLGSDQVWHPMNLEGDYKNLMFVPDHIPKIVYGASFGVNTIPKNQTIPDFKKPAIL